MEPERKTWIREILFVGAIYFVIGRLFTLPVHQSRAWRLAAWVVSAGVFLAQITYERFRFHSPPRAIAWHAALAVAFGAFGLAVAGMIHSLGMGAGIRPVWLLSLVLWPAMAAVPAYLVALTAALVLSRLRPNTEPE